MLGVNTLVQPAASPLLLTSVTELGCAPWNCGVPSALSFCRLPRQNRRFLPLLSTL